MEEFLNINISSNSQLLFTFDQEKEKKSEKQKKIEKEVYKLSEESNILALFSLGLSDQNIDLSASVNFWRKFSFEFIESLRLRPDLKELRHNIPIDINEEIIVEKLKQIPFSQGAEYLNIDLLTQVWAELHSFFQKEIRKFKGDVEDYFQQFNSDLHLLGKIYFHLVENRRDDEFPFAFLATYSSRVENGKSKHRPLKHALVEHEDDQKKMLELLSTVNLAAKKSNFISDILKNGDLFHPLSWRSTDAFKFLQDVPFFEEAGILCRVPNWWKKKNLAPKLSITIGGKKPSYLGLKSVLDFQANFTVDGIQLTLEEIRSLLVESEGLAYIKGKWITIDKDHLEETISSWEKANKLMKDSEITLSEALRILMSPDNANEKLGLGDLDEENLEIDCGKWLESVFDRMRNPDIM